MSDQSLPPEGGQAAPEAADDGATAQRPTAPPLQITAQYVKDLSFENPNAPESLMPGAPPPQVSVAVDVRTTQLNAAEQTYEVVLHVRAEAKSGDKQSFLVEIAYGGVTKLTSEVKREHVAPLLLVEAPRMMFPFARAIIASATRDGGFPPLLVQPIDFLDLFRRQLAAMRERAGKQGEGAAPTDLGGLTPEVPPSGTTTQ